MSHSPQGSLPPRKSKPKDIHRQLHRETFDNRRRCLRYLTIQPRRVDCIEECRSALRPSLVLQGQFWMVNRGVVQLEL